VIVEGEYFPFESINGMATNRSSLPWKGSANTCKVGDGSRIKPTWFIKNKRQLVITWHLEKDYNRRKFS
jgi:hypothetical protein